MVQRDKFHRGFTVFILGVGGTRTYQVQGDSRGVGLRIYSKNGGNNRLQKPFLLLETGAVWH